MASPFRILAQVEQDPPEPRLRRMGRWFMTPKVGNVPWWATSGVFYGQGLAQLLLSACTVHGLWRLWFGLALILFGFVTAYLFHKRSRVPERDAAQARRVQ